MAVPTRRSASQGLAGRAERWPADAGVKKAALQAAASHHALAGDRQPGWGARRAPWRAQGSNPPGSRLDGATRPRCRDARASGAGATAVAARGRRGDGVERPDSSDMLHEPKCLGISRGFEFSETCKRRCRAAAAPAAIDASFALREVGARARGAKLDSVRNLRSLGASAPRGPTPGGGARGGAPPSGDLRACASPPATRAWRLGFRVDRDRTAAARALQRTAGGCPIGRLRMRGLEPARGR